MKKRILIATPSIGFLILPDLQAIVYQYKSGKFHNLPKTPEMKIARSM
jgi:hypothetical protein